jgi:ferritin
MLSKKMLKGLSEQITKELYSSYLYLQMAGYFENQTLAGMATWMKIQAQEEIAHAMIFYNYVNSRNAYIKLGPIAEPPSDFKSPLDIFEKTLSHEQTVTASIYNLVDIANAEKDHATRNRLEWFIMEQVEEEANPTTIIGKLNLIGGKGEALLLLDQELGTRTFTMPEPLAGATAPTMPAAPGA